MNNWKIAVIGAGSMGRGIAQIAATHGHEVYLYDQNPQSITEASTFLQYILNRLVEKKRLTDPEAKAIFGRIYFVDSLAHVRDAKLVIEAIIEDIDIKKKVFTKLSEILNNEAILATNTSSLSISAIAHASKYPERVIGIHFFNPAPLMELVEIIPAIQTSQQTINQATRLIELWGKTTVKAKNTPGFIVNRIARPFYSEPLQIYEEGIATPAEIDYAMKEIGGFRMGPFQLMDFIGNDVNYAVTESVFKAFYYDPRYKPSLVQKNLVDAHWLGKKSGKGFYTYPVNDASPEINISHEDLEVVFMRILVMLINEAADAIYLNIASAEDIEIAMTKGVNYPKGLLAWANEIGIERCINTLDELHEMYSYDRYRCSPMLRILHMEDAIFNV